MSTRQSSVIDRPSKKSDRKGRRLPRRGRVPQQFRLLRTERLEGRRLLSIGGPDEPDWLASPDEIAIESQQIISPDEAGVETFLYTVENDEPTDADRGWVLAPDSAEIVSGLQVVGFDPLTRTYKVFPLNESVATAEKLNLLPDADSEPGFAGIGIGPWATETSASSTLPDGISPDEEATTADDPPGTKAPFPPDERIPVPELEVAAPTWSSSGRLWVENFDGSHSAGTGTMIDEFFLLTAGHVVFEGGAGPAGAARQVVFSPAQDGEIIDFRRSKSQPYGEVVAPTPPPLRWYSFLEWINDGNIDYDMAWVELDRNIGNYTGWLGYGFNNDDSFYSRNVAHTVGYPGVLTPTEHDMFYGTGNAADFGITAHQLRTNTIDTNPGHSGGPLYYVERGDRIVRGVLSGSTDPLMYNRFTRMTPDKFTIIRDQIAAAAAPIDKPDLVDDDYWFNTDDATIDPSPVTPGANFKVESYVRNNGTAAAGRFTVSFYASTDTTIDATDHLIGETTVWSLSPFETKKVTWEGKFPSMPKGTYNVGWIIDLRDDVKAEFDETKNTGMKANSQLTVAGMPDLLDGGGSGVSSTTVSDDTVGWSVWTNIRNDGDGNAGAFTVTYYASTDGTITTDDFILGSDVIPGIPAGGTVRSEANHFWGFRPHFPEGATYTVGWIIDSAGTVFERNESNNTASLGGTLRYNSDNRFDADLYDTGAGSFTPREVKPELGPAWSVSARIANRGTTFANLNSVRFYASTNTTISHSDYFLGEVDLPWVIYPGDVVTAQLSFAPGDFPNLPDNTYYVGWIIMEDPNLRAELESNETNNTAFIGGYQLRVKNKPDLHDDGNAASGFAPPMVEPGDAWSPEFDVRNGGTASAGSFWVFYYASKDETITPADYLIGWDRVGEWVDIAPGSSERSQLDPFSFPNTVPNDEYFVGWIIDPYDEVEESNETNNTTVIRGNKLTVEKNLPDLYDDSVDDNDPDRSHFVERSVTPGDAWHVHSRIGNQGPADSGGFVVDFYASLDQTITTDDYFLGWEAFTGIRAGGSRMAQETLKHFPNIPPGKYWVGWIIDSLNDAGGNVDELDETNNTSFHAGYMLTVLGTTPPPVVTIIVPDPNAAETDSDPGVMRIERLGPTDDPLVVRYTVAGSATSGADYPALANWVTIPAGAFSVPITIAPIDDNLVEGPETVQLTLDPDPAYFIGAADSATVTIADNDTATISFVLVADNVDEGLPGGIHRVEVLLTVSNGGTLAADVSVDVVDLLTGTALPTGVDYNVWDTGVTFPAGSGSGTEWVNVSIIDDHLVEGPETIDFSLQNLVDPTGQVSLAAPVGHTVTIVDNDTVTIKFVLAADSIGEAGLTQTVEVVLTVSDGGELTQDVWVDVVDLLSGTATPGGVDYAYATPTTLMFPAGSGSATKSVTFTIIDDNLVEGPETVNLKLQNLVDPTGQVSLVAPTAHLLTIVDNDTATIRFAVAASGVDETSSSLTVDVVLTVANGGTLAKPVSVDVVDLRTEDAKRGIDYTYPTPTTPTTVTFPAGSSSGATQSVTVTITNDKKVEGPETLSLGLENLVDPTGQVSVVAPLGHTVTIVDNDRATIRFPLVSSSVLEGALTKTVDIVLETIPSDATLELAVSVDVVDLLGGSAAPGGVDYAYAMTTLTFQPGDGNEKTRPVTVTIVDDALVEGSETLRLGLQNLLDLTGGQVLLKAPLTHLLAIADDDTTTIRFALAADSVDEASPTQTVDVVLTVAGGGILTGAVSVDVVDSLTGSAASGGEDYTYATPTTVTFPAGSTSGTRSVTVAIVNDTKVEGSETVDLSLQNLVDPTGQVSLVAFVAHTLTIDDDDTATIRFALAADSVNEASPTQTVDVVLTVSDNGTLARAVSVDVVDLLTGSAAPGGEDYTYATPTTVTFPAGSTSGTRSVTVAIIEDTLVEGPEAVGLSLQNLVDPTGQVLLAGFVVHNVTIVDSQETGEIHGSSWYDPDGDTVWDAAEPGMPNWTIYLDMDNSADFNAGDVPARTGAGGNYSFTGLAPGTYTVAEAMPAGWVQTFPGSPSAAKSLLSTIDAADFDTNAANTGGSVFTPADPIGAAGPNHVVNVVKASIEWYTKGGVQQSSQSLQTFFAPLSPVNFTFDPKVIYDQYAGRFLVVTLERQDTAAGDPVNSSRILVAVSDDSDPNGTWHYHAIDSKISIRLGDVLEDRWANNSGFAVDEEAVYITANMFGFLSGSGTYAGTRLWIMDKGEVGGFYAGGAAAFTVHDPVAENTVGTALPNTTQPAHVFGAPAAFGTFLVLSMTTNQTDEFLSIMRVDDPLGTPTFSNQFVNVGNIDDNATLPDAPQLGTDTLVEVNDRRALNAVWRNDSLWISTTIVPNSGPDAGQTTAHWFEVDTTSLSELTLADQGDVGGEDIAEGTFTFFPSVMVDAAGNMAIGFAASGPSIYPGAYYTSRLASDPAGTVQPSSTLAAGLDYYVRTSGGSRNRWGDYSGLALDPTDEATFWVYNQYAMQRGTMIGGEDGRWATRWGSFSLGSSTPGTHTVVLEPGDVVRDRDFGNRLITPATISGRHVFYNHSTFDGNDPQANPEDDGAIASDKEALSPGRTATFANYTSYDKGINGIMVDIAGMADPGNLGAADFRFEVIGGNDLDGWADGPDPLPIAVREGAGVDGSDRVTIRWEDNAIKNQWLKVTVRATGNTGLAKPDVFYFGNVPAEAGDNVINTIVNATDEIAARNFQHSAADPAAIDDPYDYNRDGLVNGTDQIIARNNQTNPLTMLRLIEAPAVDAAIKQAAMEDQDTANALSAALDWQYEFESMQSKGAKSKDVEATVDLLLAVGLM